MALWCVSGFVMMYQSYPKLETGARLKALAPLRLTQLQGDAPIKLADDAKVAGFSLEMMGGRPVLQVQRGGGRTDILDLNTGGTLGVVDAGEVTRTAEAFAKANGVGGTANDLGVVDVDQWTLDGINRSGPMHHIVFGDKAGTEIYVAEKTGQVVQETTTRLRLISWFGAIPHWLYPTALRKDPQTWNTVVVTTSIIGTFLTLIGMYIGIAKFKRYKTGNWSPYRGWFYWHHIIGLVFGVLTLTWVFSGLLTMGPFGFLRSDAGRAERTRMAGQISGADVKAMLGRLPGAAGGDLVSLEAAPFGGKLYLMATDRDGRTVRWDDQAKPSPLTAEQVQGQLKKVAKAPIAAFERMDTGDDYYYSGLERRASFPAYRARLSDADGTVFYLDGQTGRMVKAVDKTGRQSRFWRVGLHDFDFSFMRARPLWDIIIWILLGGTTAVCITGAWMSWLRIQRDFEPVGRWLKALFSVRQARTDG